MINKAVVVVLSLFCGLIFSSCSDSGVETKKREIFVSIPPVAFIAKSIAGDKVIISTMIPKGHSPHDYTPAPRQIAQLQSCSAYMTIGLPFEKQVIEPMFSSDKSRIINISTGIVRRKIDQEHEHDHHKHNSECDHDHDHEADKTTENLDPHIWLSPENDIKIAKNTAEALSKLYPADAAYFQQNYQKFEKQFMALNSGLKKILEPYKGEVFYVYHPAFGYFADAYKMKQEAVEIEGKSPTPKHLNEMIAAARKDKVKIILVQPQFNQRSADVIARALDAKVMELDPLTDNLVDFYHRFAAALAEGTAGDRAK